MRVYQTTIAELLSKMVPIDQPHMTIKGTILKNRRLYGFLSPERGPVLWLESPDAAKVKKYAQQHGIGLEHIEADDLQAFTVQFTCSESHPVTPNDEPGSSAQLEGKLAEESTYHCWVCQTDFNESALARL